MHAHVLHTFAYVSAASAASPAPTQPSMKEAALRAASTKGGGRHTLWIPSWMVAWALGTQQTRQKHMQMYATHEHACTLYG